MATATPSSRWRASAGCSSVNCWKSCLTDVAESWNSATPPVICARLPTRTTRGIKNVGAPKWPPPPRARRAPGNPGRSSISRHGSDLAGETPLLQSLEHLGWRHRQLGEADTGGVLHRVGDGAERWDDGRLADATHAVRMARVRDLDEDRVDHRHVGRDGHPIVEEARVL